ncbi:unnamed protein product [Prorocentrum cordatum]|uniref:Uncharacterized protein n=1 Tax=Prorocentrum cordatum TaxID=2364126 RepID=A0ABN9RXB9_9DINO|nr:unnamed protein product [Polarella glacialis]
MRARLLGEPPRSSKTRRAAGLSRTPPLRARGRARQVQAAPANGAGKTGAHLRDSRRRAQREQKTGRRRRSRGRRRRRRRTGRLCPSEKPSAPTPPLRNARRGSPPQPPAWCRPPAPRERRGDKMVVRTSGGLCRARRRSGETLCKPDRPRSRTSWRAGRWRGGRAPAGRAARSGIPGAAVPRPPPSRLQCSRRADARAGACPRAARVLQGGGEGGRRLRRTQEEGGRPRVKPAVYCRPPQAKGARAKRLAAGRCLHYPAQGGKETLYKEIAPAGGFRGDGQCQSPPIDMALISQLPWAAGRSKIRGARARSGAGCPVGGEKKHLGAGAGQRAAASCHPKPAIRGR